jgi:hypothetical protein
VPSFVVDTTILAPGTTDPDSTERKLLVLAAYGRLHHYARFGRDEIENPSAPAGTLGGRPVEELIEVDATRASVLGGRLPPNAPSDFLLALSLPILDQFEAFLREAGVGRGLGMSAELAARLRRTALALAVVAPSFLSNDVRHYFGVPQVDLLVETAFRSRAQFVVSNAPQVDDRSYEEIAHPVVAAQSVTLMHVNGFLQAMLPDGFDFEAIAGPLLDFAGPLLPS